MKRTILFALTAIAFLVLPSSKILAQATVQDSHFESNYNFYLVTCDGTLVNVQTHDTFDGHAVINKNKVNLSYHLKGDFTGVDAAGNTYIGHGTRTSSVSIPLENGAYSFTEVFKVILVGQGSAPNISYSYTEKFTVNANGDVSVDRFDYNTTCD